MLIKVQELDFSPLRMPELCVNDFFAIIYPSYHGHVLTLKVLQLALDCTKFRRRIYFWVKCKLLPENSLVPNYMGSHWPLFRLGEKSCCCLVTL